MAPNFYAGAYPLGKTAKALPTRGGGGVDKCAEGIQNAHFSKGQKLTHSPVREEKDAEHHKPLHYTH